MTFRKPSEIGGYVLAGGQSSRMGCDKALLCLAGKPLVLHAVVKLRRVCMEVSVLGSNPELDAYAPLVRDVHPGCGPMGGLEAALLQSRFEWNLFLPVDVPFVPTVYLDGWVRQALPQAAQKGARVMMFTVDQVPQPTLALVHRDVRPFLTKALEHGEYKLYPVLESAARALAERDGFQPGAGLWKLPYWSQMTSRPGPQHKGEEWWYTNEAQARGSARWFANLNTPEEFAEAERHVDALDT